MSSEGDGATRRSTTY